MLSLSMQGPLLFYIKSVCASPLIPDPLPPKTPLRMYSRYALKYIPSTSMQLLGSVCIPFKFTQMGSRLTSHFIFLFLLKTRSFGLTHVVLQMGYVFSLPHASLTFLTHFPREGRLVVSTS